jgi:hypothetical protein
MEVTMKKLTNTLFIAVLLSSCTHYYYLQNIQNVPLFKGKNEYRLSASLGTGRASTSTELQAAYSITNNIGVMTNYMSARGGSKSGRNWGKGNYLEGAIGYYKPIGTSGVFELYSGFGGSKQYHEYTTTVWDGIWLVSRTYYGTSSLSFNKIFIQPSYGVFFDNFDFAFSTRIGELFYHKIDNQITCGSIDYIVLNNIAKNKNYLFIEPAITARGGWESFKFQIQLAYTSYLNKSDMNFEPSHFSIGLYLPLSKKTSKNDSKN